MQLHSENIVAEEMSQNQIYTTSSDLCDLLSSVHCSLSRFMTDVIRRHGVLCTDMSSVFFASF